MASPVLLDSAVFTWLASLPNATLRTDPPISLIRRVHMDLCDRPSGLPHSFRASRRCELFDGVAAPGLEVLG